MSNAATVKRIADPEETRACQRQGYKLFKKKLLGFGSFGRVFEGKAESERIHKNEKLQLLLNNTKRVAIKILDVGGSNCKKLEQATRIIPQEIAMINSCFECPQVLKLFDVFVASERVFLVTELAERGTLAHLMKSLKKDCCGYMQEDLARYYFHKISSGVNFLHSRNIAHRDLKLSNVFVTKSFAVKLGDFGFSSKVHKASVEDGILSLKTSFCGTPSYAAPEILRLHPYDAIQADLWSLGVILFKLVHGEYPFAGIACADVLKSCKKHFAGQETLTFREDVSESCRELVCKLLRLKPSSRLPAYCALRHSWTVQKYKTPIGYTLEPLENSKKLAEISSYEEFVARHKDVENYLSTKTENLRYIEDIPDRLKSYLRKARDEDKLGKIPTPLKAVHPPSSIESVASNESDYEFDSFEEYFSSDDSNVENENKNDINTANQKQDTKLETKFVQAKPFIQADDLQETLTFQDDDTVKQENGFPSLPGQMGHTGLPGQTGFPSLSGQNNVNKDQPKYCNNLHQSQSEIDSLYGEIFSDDDDDIFPKSKLQSKKKKSKQKFNQDLLTTLSPQPDSFPQNEDTKSHTEKVLMVKSILCVEHQKLPKEKKFVRFLIDGEKISPCHEYETKTFVLKDIEELDEETLTINFENKMNNELFNQSSKDVNENEDVKLKQKDVQAKPSEQVADLTETLTPEKFDIDKESEFPGLPGQTGFPSLPGQISVKKNRSKHYNNLRESQSAINEIFGETFSDDADVSCLKPKLLAASSSQPDVCSQSRDSESETKEPVNETSVLCEEDFKKDFEYNVSEVGQDSSYESTSGSYLETMKDTADADGTDNSDIESIPEDHMIEHSSVSERCLLSFEDSNKDETILEDVISTDMQKLESCNEEEESMSHSVIGIQPSKCFLFSFEPRKAIESDVEESMSSLLLLSKEERIYEEPATNAKPLNAPPNFSDEAINTDLQFNYKIDQYDDSFSNAFISNSCSNVEQDEDFNYEMESFSNEISPVELNHQHQSDKDAYGEESVIEECTSENLSGSEGCLLDISDGTSNMGNVIATQNDEPSAAFLPLKALSKPCGDTVKKDFNSDVNGFDDFISDESTSNGFYKHEKVVEELDEKTSADVSFSIQASNETKEKDDQSGNENTIEKVSCGKSSRSEACLLNVDLHGKIDIKPSPECEKDIARQEQKIKSSCTEKKTSCRSKHFLAIQALKEFSSETEQEIINKNETEKSKTTSDILFREEVDNEIEESETAPKNGSNDDNTSKNLLGSLLPLNVSQKLCVDEFREDVCGEKNIPKECISEASLVSSPIQLGVADASNQIKKCDKEIKSCAAIADTVCKDALNETVSINHEMNEINDLFSLKIAGDIIGTVHRIGNDNNSDDECEEVISEDSMSMSSLEFLTEESCSEDEEENHSKENYADETDSDAKSTVCSSSRQSIENCKWEAELDAPSANKHEAIDNFHITDTICHEALQEALDVNNELNEIEDILPFNLLQARNNDVYKTDSTHDDECKEVVIEESMSVSSLVLVKEESCSEAEQECTNSEEHDITEGLPTRIDEHCRQSIIKGLEIFANEDLPDDLVEELLENSSKLLKFCYERGVNIQSQASEQAAKPSTEEIVDESSHHYQEPCQESNTLNTATSNQDVVQMDDNAEEYDQFHPSENLIDENGYEEDFEVSDIESDDVNSNSAMIMSTINFLTEESLGEDEEGLSCFEDVDMSEEVPELNDEARMEVPKPPINRKNQNERTCSNKRFGRRYKKLKSDTSTKHPHPPANLVQSVNEEATKSYEIEVCGENQSVNSVGMLPPLNKAPQLCDEAIQEAFDFDYNVGRFKTPSSCQRISELNDESGKDNENEKHLQTTTCSLNSFPEDQKTDKIQFPKKEFLKCSDECHEETIPKVCLSETCSTSGLNVINTSNEKCIKNVEPPNVAKNSSDEAVKTKINDPENDISATHMQKKLSPIEATNNSDVKMDDNVKECDQSYPSDESVDVNGYEEEDFETSDIERDGLISNSSKNMSPINFIVKGSCSEDKEGSTCFENVEMFQEVSKVCDERLIEEHYKNENIPTECIKEMRPECNLISNDHIENRNDCLTNLNQNQLPHNLHDRISTEVNQSDSDCEEDKREDSMSSLVFLTEESSNEAEEECASHSEHDTHPSEVTEGIRREQLIKGLENLNYDNIPKKYVDEILKAENLANVCNENQSDNGVESTHQIEQNIKKLIESSKQYKPSEMTNKMCKEGFTEVSEYDMDEFDECASGTSMSSRNNDKEKGKIDERNITKTCINENLSASKETDKIMDSNKTTYTTTIKSKSEEILVTDDNSSTDEDEYEESMSMSSLEFLTEESCSEPEEETNAKEENDAHKKSTTEESCSKPEEACTYFDEPYAKPPPNIESRCREALMRGLEQFADENLPEGFVNEILSRPGDLFKFWQDGKANNHVSSEESHVKLQKHEQLSKTEKLTKCLNKERTSSNSDDIQSSAYLTASSSDHPSVEDCSWEAELDAPSINKHQLTENCHITDTICNEALQEALDVNNELNEIDDLLPFNLSHPRNNAVYETDKDKINVDKCKEVVSEESISISSLGLLKKESCSESEKERTNSEEHGITEENPTSVEEHCKKSLMKGLEVFANEDLPDDLVEELLGNPSKLLKFCYERGVNIQSQASDQAAKPCTEEMVDHIDNGYQEPCQDSNNLNNAASNQDAIKIDDSAEDYDQFYPSDESVDENGYAEEDFEVSDIESDDVISTSSMNMSLINFLTEESCSEKEEGSTCCEVVHMFEEVSEVCDETFIEEHQNNEGRIPEGCINDHNLQDAINIVEMEVNQSELKYEYAVNKDSMSSLVLTTAERREAEEKGISHDEHDTESDNGVGSILVLEQNVQEVKQEFSHQFKPSEFTKKICEETLTEVYEYNMNEFVECASDTSMSSRNNDKEKGKSVENNIAENCIGEKLSALKETDKKMDSNKTTKKLEEVLVTDDNTSTDEDECEESMSMSSLEFLTEESCSEAEEETKANEENDAHEKSTTKESQPEEEYTYFDEPCAKPPPNIESRCREALMRGLEQFATEDLPVGFVDEILSRPGDLFNFWQDLKANNQSCERSSSKESPGNGSCQNEKVKLQKYEKMNKTEKLNCLNKEGTSSNSDDIQSSAHECGKCNWEAELDAPSTNKHQVTENYQKFTDTICNEALQEALDVNNVLNEVDDLLPFNLSHPRNNAVYETDNDNTDGDKCEEEEVVSEESMSVSSHGLLKEESCGEAEEECTNYEEHDTNEEHPANVEEHCRHSLMKGLEIFANEDLPDDFVEELLRKPSELLKFCYDRGVNIQSQASDQAAKPCTEDNVNDIGHHYQETCQESNDLNNAASKQADVKMDDNVKEYDQSYPFEESVDENGYEEEDFDVSDIESDDVISNSSMNMSLINFLTEESCTEDEERSTCCEDVKISEEAYKAYEEALMEEHHNNENIPEECTKELRHECNMISIDRAENGNDCLTNSDQSQILENSHEVIRKKVDMDENQSDPECEEDGSEDSMSSLVFLREETCSEAEDECASHDEHDSDANPSEITEKSRKEALIKERAFTYSGNGSENNHDKIKVPDAKNQRISDQMSTSGGSIPEKYNFERTLSPSTTVPDVTDENKTLQKEPKESGKILSVTENDLAVKACNMDKKSKPTTMSVPYMLEDNSEIDDGKFQSMKTIIDAALKEVGSNDSTVPFKRVCRRSGTESSISDGVSNQKENQFSKQSGLDCQTLSSDYGSGLSNYRQVYLEMRDKYEAQIMEQQRLLQVHQLMAKQLQQAFDEKKELLSIVKSLHERVGQLEMKIRK